MAMSGTLSGPGLARAASSLSQCGDRIALDTRPRFPGTVWPVNPHLRLCLTPESEMDAHIAPAQIASVRVGPPPDAFPAVGQHRYPGANCVGIAPGCPETNFEPMIGRDRLVQQQARRPIVVRNHDIRAAVVVYVAEGRSPADVGDLKSGSSFGAHVSKERAFVVQQQIPLLERVRRSTQRLDDGNCAVGNE